MEIVLIGAGGHSKVIKDIIHARKGAKLLALLDDKYPELRLESGVYTGPISSAQTLLKEKHQLKFIVAIGDNEIRRSVVDRLSLADEHYVSLIHETAIISPSATIGRGTVVMAKAVVHAAAKVGHHAVVNTGAIIEHDAILGDYVHAAPNVTLTGAVQAAEGAMIGAAATVIPGKTIGKWAIIGAGATVISDIPADSTAVGTPARVIHRQQKIIADINVLKQMG
jgi:acetyltransferase EpsM